MMDQTFTISLFHGIGDSRPMQVVRTWNAMCARFAAPTVRDEKDGPLFSPARYRAPRRLIANVIELSLLVLEVDGAWKCDDCGHQGPLVMFRNRRHEGDRCPACKKRNRKLERSNVSQIQFNLPALAAACRRTFPSAFALYSTHGHLRVTDTNPLAEPRFRIVIPLSKPVPVSDFLELWFTAVEQLKEVPADPQVKDANRIYYTPVKFSESSPYEFHIEPGEPLDWKLFLMSPEPVTTDGESGGHAVATKRGAERQPAPDLFSTEQKALVGVGDSVVAAAATAASEDGAVSANEKPTPSAVLSANDIYSSHEARHAELCRRIVARGKQNGRGNYDARCLAHGGKGTSALFHNPRSGAVSCNKECLYEELLRAEGLDDRKLPSAARAAVWQAATVKSPREPGGSRQEQSAGSTTATSPRGSEGSRSALDAGGTPAVPVVGLSDSPSAVITLARLHVINALLLAHLFELSPEDATAVQRHWGPQGGEDIEWPGTDEKKPVKVCSFPSRLLQLEAAKRLGQEFNLEATPGFYRVAPNGVANDAFVCLGPEGKRLRDQVAQYGPWRVALDLYRMRPGALLVPYDNGSGYICGIQIYRSIRDKCPFLLTSYGLPGGAKAVAYRQVAA